MDYYQILGVSPDCDRETLHRAFRELSIKFHPDRYTETARKLAEKRYQQMVVAFNTLKDRNLRSRYDRMNKIAHQVSNIAQKQTPSSSHEPVGTITSNKSFSLNQMDPEVLARQHFQAGVTKFNRGELAEALEHFNLCQAGKSKDPEVYFFKGMCELKIPSAKRQSVGSLQKATQLNPKEAKYHLALIKALAGFGLQSRVSSSLERALQFLPDHPELLALDQEINPEKYKKSLFGNLFGKK